MNILNYKRKNNIYNTLLYKHTCQVAPGSDSRIRSPKRQVALGSDLGIRSPKR
jgi:hypothetical protein